MRHTLKAVFDDRGKAQQQLDKLLDSGYSSADAMLLSVPGDRQAGSAGEDTTPKWRERSGTSAARFLARPFDHAHSDPAKAAANPCSPESYVLTLATYSEPEAERASSLISGFVRMDNEVSGTTATRDGQSGIAHASYQRSSAPGALQYYARDTSHNFGTRDADDTAMIGTTFREPMLPAGYWPSTRGDAPAMHAALTGPTDGDNEVRAAYRFGHDMHENDRYRNRSWNEAVGDLKVLWETRDPEEPVWESFEPAVHLGWDSTRPEIDDDSYHRSHWNTKYVTSAAHMQAEHVPTPSDTSARPNAAWKLRHPGEPTAWENFMDALRHGWERIRIGNDMDEADYRRHHASTYPGTRYDDFAPVYRYGNNVRSRNAFRGRSWEDIESELRAEWDRGHREGKPSTWDDMKAAIRHGWYYVV